MDRVCHGRHKLGLSQVKQDRPLRQGPQVPKAELMGGRAAHAAERVGQAGS